MNIGSNLKAIRLQLGLTQSQLSELSGVELNHISKIELDKSDPKLSTIYKLINALGVTPDALLLLEQPIMEIYTNRIRQLPLDAKAVVYHLVSTYVNHYGSSKGS